MATTGSQGLVVDEEREYVLAFALLSSPTLDEKPLSLEVSQANLRKLLGKLFSQTA